MLVVLYGPSGAGKTTLMLILAEKFEAYLIPTVMTRPMRPGENDKVVVTPEEFLRQENVGSFLHVNDLFGFKYGTPKEAIEKAVSSDDLWLFDFPYGNRGVFANIPHVPIVVVPEGPEQLAQQLRDSGRAERIEAALADYHNVYAPLLKQTSGDTAVVINRYDRTDDAITTIIRILDRNEHPDGSRHT